LYSRTVTIEVRPVDADRWPDLAKLFGPQGAYSGCWCMFWRLPNAEMNSSTPDERRDALEVAARSGPVGLLAYAGGEPAGWCAVAPRSEFRRLPRTKALAPHLAPDRAVWSVTCFYIRKDRRRTGVAGALLDAAVGYAKEHGATLVEAYPAPEGTTSSARLSTGTVHQYARAGFQAVPADGNRMIMRYALDG
jgi:GNAT superfamily N-acetyltransferase